MYSRGRQGDGLLVEQFRVTATDQAGSSFLHGDVKHGWHRGWLFVGGHLGWRLGIRRDQVDRARRGRRRVRRVVSRREVPGTATVAVDRGNRKGGRTVGGGNRGYQSGPDGSLVKGEPVQRVGRGVLRNGGGARPVMEQRGTGWRQGETRLGGDVVAIDGAKGTCVLRGGRRSRRYDVLHRSLARLVLARIGKGHRGWSGCGRGFCGVNPSAAAETRTISEGNACEAESETHASEQYRTELSGTFICFSHVAL